MISQAQTLNDSAKSFQAPLVEAALLRDLDIAGQLSCLTAENLDHLRHGRSPIVSCGPYGGEPAEVDHVVPVSVEPELCNEIANLELLPRTLNRRKGARIGERQQDYREELRQADLIEAVAPE
ncbi:MAG: HNH endonuclease signature motif containing protein [Spartobacteria bacterium]